MLPPLATLMIAAVLAGPVPPAAPEARISLDVKDGPLVDIVSGEVPAIEAETKIVGISALGIDATGNRKNAVMPASANPTVSRVVAIGRRMNGSATAKMGR